MFSKLILWIIVLAAGVVILISINVFRGRSDDISLETPSPSETAIPSPSESASPTSVPSPKQTAASCQISGQIIFLNKNLYENKNARIFYQNVDDVIRQIYWKSDPDDGVLVIGPNLFEDLPLPNGERNVGVSLAKETSIKNYNLTASITYGVKNANGEVKERIANCTGKVSVKMPEI